MTEVFNEKIFIVEVIITKFAASLKPEQDQRTKEMKKRILNILMYCCLQQFLHLAAWQWSRNIWVTWWKIRT